MLTPQIAPVRFDPHPLDRPPWSALMAAHAPFALGNNLARRYRPEFAPMAAVREASNTCLASLRDLMQPGDIVGLFDTEAVYPGVDLKAVAHKTVEQMVFVESDSVALAEGAVTLGVDDVPAMMELVKLTNPGPFARRTVELGTYIGIRRGGRLVAMAGERMKFDGFVEISAVCTDPGHRGKGYASALVRTLRPTYLGTVQRRSCTFSATTLRRKLSTARSALSSAVRSP